MSLNEDQMYIYLIFKEIWFILTMVKPIINLHNSGQNYSWKLNIM